jgi:hypothetical protein
MIFIIIVFVKFILPLAKFGCILGGLAMLVPGLICALGQHTSHCAADILEQSQAAQVDLLGMGVPVELDFIELLNLVDIQTLLTSLDDQRWLVALLIILINLVGGGLVVALTIMVVGWSYNLLAALTGGLEVELRE